MSHFPISIIFLIISKFQFLDIDKLPIISEMPIYRLPIIFHRYIVHPYLWQNHPAPPFRHHRTIPSEKFPDCCIGKSRFINGDGGHFPWISRRKWNHQIWWQYRCWPIFSVQAKIEVLEGSPKLVKICMNCKYFLLFFHNLKQ